ncbi:hypothetical protein ACGC1H_005223 [Rhizoctonia solani]
MPKPTKSGMSSNGINSNLKLAFEEPYKGETAHLFIKSLNKIRCFYVGRPAADRPYNWSVAVIQSSGMGKSRMVEQSSLSMFTIPINIREDPPAGKKGKSSNIPNDRFIAEMRDCSLSAFRYERAPIFPSLPKQR